MPPMSFMPTYIAIWLEHYSNVATWSMGFRSKKWGDEWVTVMTTTPTEVQKTTCNLESASLPWVMWIYEVDELVAPLEKRLHNFCSN